MLISVLALALQQEVIQSAESKGTVDKVSFTIWFNHSCLLIFGFPASCIMQFMRTSSVSPVRMWRFFLEKQEWNTLNALMYVLTLSVLFLLPNLAWAATLKSISVTLVAAAGRFDSIFVLIFTSLLTLEAPPLVQVCSVFACIAGVIFIAIGQSSGSSSDIGHTSIVDCFVVLVAPCLSALYYMVFGRLTKGCSTDPECICIILSLMGLCNLLLLWPVLPISVAAGLDNQHLQEIFTVKGIRSICLNAALASAGNFTQMPAIALTSPLFVSLAMLLLLPITLVIDVAIMHKASVNAWLICGSLIVVCGFCMSTVFEAYWKAPARHEKCREGLMK